MDELKITIFTDPLCCWSWAFEPELEKIKSALAGRANFNYRMGGLLPSWNNFHDEVNSVTRPVQMGPVWMHAGQIAGRPICHQLWMMDPPASSYPACIAVKCAQLQSLSLGERMLNLLREACMSEGKNIAKQNVLFEVAEKLGSLDVEQFKNDFTGEKGMEAFRTDLELVRYYNINRFPALVIRSGGKAVMISGYRHSEEVMRAVEAVVGVGA